MVISDNEIEPLCKVECLNEDCEHHLQSRGWYSCNLKHVVVSRQGMCVKYIKLKRENKHRTYSEDTKEALKKLGHDLEKDGYEIVPTSSGGSMMRRVDAELREDGLIK